MSNSKKVQKKQGDINILNYVRFLSYLGDKETPGLIRVILPYLILNKYNNILANFDFIMSNATAYFNGLNILQVQRLATKDQLQVLKAIKTHVVPKYGFPIFYDIDDLITDMPEFNITHKYYKENVEYVKEILEIVDCIVCSTTDLAKQLSKFNKTKVIENRLFKPLWNLHKHTSFFETNTKPKIIWAGGHTHFSDHVDKENDFDKQITRYIKETSDKFEWIFFGHRPKELENTNITFHKWVSYFDFPDKLREIDPDIGIALLQVNDFNKCKSNLKAMENVSLGIPGVYTNIAPYQHMSCKINNADQFIEKIEKLTTDQDYYEKIRLQDYNILKNNLYWDDDYIKKYLDIYFEKKK